MRDSTPQPIVQELARTTPELRAYVESLQADSDQLQKLTNYDDPGEKLQMLALVSVTVIRGCAVEGVMHNPKGENMIHTLADFIGRFGDALFYRQRTIAAQKRVA